MAGSTAEKPNIRFFSGNSLEAELDAAMERIRAYGVTYPEGYGRILLKKYTEEGVRYPHILMILGRPRINHHSCYPRLFGQPGRFLDYGCGTGDNIRQLIRDGFPRERITAFDINGDSIGLGLDLYRDGEAMDNLFVVSDRFPFGNREFGIVYSASVIHVIADDREFRAYLENAYSVLRYGGVFFGSTLGLKEGASRSPDARGPPRILTAGQLESALTCAGFRQPAIVRRNGVPGYVPGSGDLCVLEFSTGK